MTQPNLTNVQDLGLQAWRDHAAKVEAERDRLRADKARLENQLEEARFDRDAFNRAASRWMNLAEDQKIIIYNTLNDLDNLQATTSTVIAQATSVIKNASRLDCERAIRQAKERINKHSEYYLNSK